MAATTEWTLGSLLDWTAKHLATKGVEHPRLDAEVLLAHAVPCKRIDLYGIRFAEPASAETRQKYKDLIRRRVEGCPVAYLVGRKEFFGLTFAVTPDVLIPRPDTENVITEALSWTGKFSPCRVVDVGTGSGAIACSIAKQAPAALVTAIDVSPKALAVAKQNAETLGLAERMQFLESDLFASLPAEEMFDLILSNPPYIATEEIPKLPIGVREFEPRAALDGGLTGFEVFERLIAQSKDRLTPGGALIVEIGSAQEAGARQRLEAIGGFEVAPTVFDHSGHPRVIVARRV